MKLTNETGRTEGSRERRQPDQRCGSEKGRRAGGSSPFGRHRRSIKLEQLRRPKLSAGSERVRPKESRPCLEGSREPWKVLSS